MSDDLDEIVKQIMRDCVSSGRKPSGYWKEIENVKKELESIIEELGRFPTQREINGRNSSLSSAINIYHGGVNKIRELYGEKPIHTSPGYWKDINNINAELEPVIEALGHFPKQKELVEINCGLNLAISKYHGGLNRMRKIYGGKLLHKPNGHWKEIENVKKELEPIIEELGRFPTSRELSLLNSGLSTGIDTYHGGVNKIREMYGEKLLHKPNGYWKEISNVKMHLDELIGKLGHFPTSGEMMCVVGLKDGIKNYHNSITSIKIKLGYADQELEILQELMEGLKDD